VFLSDVLGLSVGEKGSLGIVNGVEKGKADRRNYRCSQQAVTARTILSERTFILSIAKASVASHSLYSV
jgi:hypothetical protein